VVLLDARARKPTCRDQHPGALLLRPPRLVSPGRRAAVDLGDVIARIRRNRRTKDITAVCPACRPVRGAPSRRTAILAEVRAHYVGKPRAAPIITRPRARPWRTQRSLRDADRSGAIYGVRGETPKEVGLGRPARAHDICRLKAWRRWPSTSSARPDATASGVRTTTSNRGDRRQCCARWKSRNASLVHQGRAGEYNGARGEREPDAGRQDARHLRARAARHQRPRSDRVVHSAALLSGDHPGAHRGGSRASATTWRTEENVVVGRLIPAERASRTTASGVAGAPRKPWARPRRPRAKSRQR